MITIKKEHGVNWFHVCFQYQPLYLRVISFIFILWTIVATRNLLYGAFFLTGPLQWLCNSCCHQVENLWFIDIFTLTASSWLNSRLSISCLKISPGIHSIWGRDQCHQQEGRDTAAPGSSLQGGGQGQGIWAGQGHIPPAHGWGKTVNEHGSYFPKETLRPLILSSYDIQMTLALR